MSESLLPELLSKRAELRELQRENAALRNKFMFAESEIILLRDEREELREALKPFAEYAIQHGPMNLHGRNGALITVEHWQTAIHPTKEAQHAVGSKE